VIATTPIRVFE